jgi:CO/xanthine dehydrogenase FAD-binding subunit
VAGAAVKPPPFEYAAPSSLEEALGLLHGDDQAVALAGGQSLVPLLNFRLARPATVVDLNRIEALSGLYVSGGTLRIGALTRQAALERSAAVAQGWPLLLDAVRMVGHPAIRNRGTVGGSVAHADPRAELPAVMIALDARFHLRSLAGARTVPAGEFFVGPMWTALAPGELLTEIEVPPLPAGARTAFTEHARTHGDFAIAGAAAVVADGEGARVALLGAGPVATRAGSAERALGAGADPAEVAALAGAEVGDEYRSALIAALVREAISSARG